MTLVGLHDWLNKIDFRIGNHIHTLEGYLFTYLAH